MQVGSHRLQISHVEIAQIINVSVRAAAEMWLPAELIKLWQFGILGAPCAGNVTKAKLMMFFLSIGIRENEK